MGGKEVGGRVVVRGNGGKGQGRGRENEEKRKKRDWRGEKAGETRKKVK